MDDHSGGGRSGPHWGGGRPLDVQAQGASTRADPFKSSYLSVNEKNFRAVFARMSATKPQVMKRPLDLLNSRYDLMSGRPPASR